MIALRARDLGKYFGPEVETDGVAKPREALRSLLRIAGIDIDTSAPDDVQRTVAAAGHVLRDVTFTVDTGSVVCLAGPSGAGKSVLLQILAGVTAPDAGTVEIYVPVTPLLSIGDNLNERLTARENIETSPYVERASADEAARYAAEVIDFAELHGFEDVAIRTYSTGMVLRLSVALALCGRPSLVLIDDVLNVGDIGFQQRCIDRVHELKDAGSTLMLAFSDEALVRQLATRVLTLNAGRIVSDMPPHHWSTTRASGTAGMSWRISESLPESEVMALRAVDVQAVAGAGADLEMTMTIEALAGGIRCRPVVIVGRNGISLFRSVYPEFVDIDQPGTMTFTVRIPVAVLPDGDYLLAVAAAALSDRGVFALKSDDTVALEIRRGEAADVTAGPLLAFELPWEVERVALT